MDDSKKGEEDDRIPQTIEEAETERYMELLDKEVWDEAIRSYNDLLFGMFRYI